MPTPHKTAKHTGSDTGSVSDRIHHRLDVIDDTLTAGGVELHGVRTLLFLWKKLGLRGLISVFLVIGFPIGEYSLLSYSVNHALPQMLGGIGVEFEADEWSLHPFTITAVARNVRIRAPHDRNGAPVLTAGEIVFAGSAWTFVRGLPDMLTFHLFGGQQPFNEVEIKHGELHLERSLTGVLNWSEIADAVPAARLDDAAKGLYRIHRLSLEDFRISYIEHIPGNSGSGVIQTSQANVNIDQVTGAVTEFVPPTTYDERPTRFKFRGRSADGVIEISGQGAFIAPPGGTGPSRERTPGLKLASTSPAAGEPAAIAGPYYKMVVYLENIGAAAYGRMVPVTTILPSGGTVGGTVTLIRQPAAEECQGYLTVKDVRFEPNARVITRRTQYDVLARGLEPVSATGRFEVCGSDDAPRTMTPAGAPRRSPPAAALLADLNTQGTANAAPAVRAIATRDQRSLSGQPVNVTLDDLTAGLAHQIGAKVTERFGDVSGQFVEQSLTGRSGTQAVPPTGAAKDADNPLTKGVKGVGNGLKRLFGRGKKK